MPEFASISAKSTYNIPIYVHSEGEIMKAKLIFIAAAAVAFTSFTNVIAQRTKGETPVKLNVIIDDTVSQGIYGYGSDGGGAYVNGVDGVEAQFLSTGVLSFNTGNRDATAYHTTAIEPIGELLSGSTTGNTYFLTFVKSGLFLQTMAIGSSRCEGLIGGTPISTDYSRYVGYRAGRGTLSDLAYMLVTRPDADTWIMNSDSGGACGSFDNIARINDAKTKGKANDIFHGRYYMPLRLILTRQ